MDGKGRTKALAAKLGEYKPPLMEYKTLRGKASMGTDGTVRGVAEVTDSILNKRAREGWRVVAARFAGRKLVACLLERPRGGKGKGKGKGKAKPAPADTMAGDGF